MNIRVTVTIEALVDTQIPRKVAEQIAGKIIKARRVGGGSSSVCTVDDARIELNGWCLGPEVYRPAPHCHFTVPVDTFRLVPRPAFPTPHIASHQSKIV